MSIKSTLLTGAALLSVVAYVGVSSALAADPAPARTVLAGADKVPAVAGAPAAKMPKQEQRAVDNASPARVKAQITELHDKLHITSAQEGKWEEVAEAMRATAKEMRTKLTDRSEKVKTASLTAIDELRAYQDLQQVQYDGVKRLVDQFEKLYGVMTPDQKMNADAVFAQPTMRAATAGGKGKHEGDAKSQ